MIYFLVDIITLLHNMSNATSNMIIGQFDICNLELILPFTTCIHN